MLSPRVLVTEGIPEAGTQPLIDAGFEVVTAPAAQDPDSGLADVDGWMCLLTDRVDRAALTAGRPRLKVVANVAVGVDNVDVSAAHELGVAVCNTPGVLDETTADLAWALLMMARRRTTAAEASLRSGHWPGWRIDGYLGHDIYGATLGLVGWGRIAQAVARRAQGFGVEVIYHARTPSAEPGYVADLDELLMRADLVSLHVPLTAATRHLIDARRLALMKPSAVLVNTARGPVVDEVALAQALSDGVIFGAGLDVFEAEPVVHPDLLAAPNAVLLPHIGSATVQTRTAMATLAARSVVEVLAGRRPSNQLT